MFIEYKVKFGQDGITVTQRIDFDASTVDEDEVASNLQTDDSVTSGATVAKEVRLSRAAPLQHSAAHGEGAGPGDSTRGSGPGDRTRGSGPGDRTRARAGRLPRRIRGWGTPREAPEYSCSRLSLSTALLTQIRPDDDGCIPS